MVRLWPRGLDFAQKEGWPLFVLLMAVWFVLNGRVTVEIGLVGLLVCGGVALFSRRALGGPPRWNRRRLRRMAAALALVPLLVWEVLLSNLHVMAQILDPRRKVRQPKLVVLDHRLEGEGARLALATAITLTPGTVTAGLGRDGKLRVCTMDERMAQGLSDFSILRGLRRMERGRDHG